MPKPKKDIRFSIETIEDMMYNEHVYAYFDFLLSLVDNNFSISFYRGDEKLTTINDAIHLGNFKRGFKFIK